MVIRAARVACCTELLENRLLFSAAPLATPPVINLGPVLSQQIHAAATGSAVSGPYQPTQIRTAYGINSISFNGTTGTGAGQTIAIIDAYNDPTIVSDANTFSGDFGLPQFNGSNQPTLRIVNQNGSASPLPANDSSSTGGWDLEEALDVEWAHAVAPQANILVFEANSSSLSDLFTAVTRAAQTTRVSVVSMSFGAGEFSGESQYDSTFTTPSGHAGVTFLASTGDSNAPAEYPAYSPNVVAVGGTSLTLNSDNSYASESAWGHDASGDGGGGGVSSYESQPSYQTGKVNGLGGTSPAYRTTPDVSILASPYTGVEVYDQWNTGSDNGGLFVLGGTSLACPMWAGLIAIADQGRALSGLASLNGKTQVLPTLYNLSSADFHDITTGNNGFAAGSGYDLATGLGTPVANFLVPQLASLDTSSPPAGAATHLAFSVQPGTSVAGQNFTVSVQALDSSNNVVSGDSSSATLSLAGNSGATLGGTTTVQFTNGVASFSLNLTKAASYTLQATDGSLASATSSAFAITPGGAVQLALATPPSATTVNSAMNTVLVEVEDSYGNVVSSNASTVTITINSSAFSNGTNTITAATSAGVATFSHLVISATGTYNFAVSDGSLSGIAGSFVVNQAGPLIVPIIHAGVYDQAAYGLSSAVADDANTGSTIAALGNGLTYSYYTGTLGTFAQVAAATALGAAPVNAGSYTVVVNYAGSANYTAQEGIYHFSITPRPVTGSIAAQNKVYDGTTAAGTVSTVTGTLGGDILTLAGGTIQFGTKDVGAGKTVMATGLSLSGASAANYVLSNPTETSTASITPRAVTGSIAAANKVYDGTDVANLIGQYLENVISGDQVQLIGGTIPTFNAKDVGAASTVTVNGLTLGGADAGNYTLENPFETTGAVITPRPVTPSVIIANKICDGTTAASILTRWLIGMVPGDDVSLAGGVATFADAKVGAAKTVNTTGLTLTGTDAQDYTLSTTGAQATASITPMTLSGTVFNDTNADGLANDNAGGVAGRIVYLEIPGRGTRGAKTTKTNAAGNFSFLNIAAGNYVVVIAAKAGWRATTPVAVNQSLAAGVSESGVAFGQSNAASVSGSVFLDTNGKLQPGKPGLAGWTLTLSGTGRSAGLSFSATTNASGAYCFTAVPPGSYRLTLAQQTGGLLSRRSAKAYSLSLAPAKATPARNFGEQLVSASALLPIGS